MSLHIPLNPSEHLAEKAYGVPSEYTRDRDIHNSKSTFANLVLYNLGRLPLNHRLKVSHRLTIHFSRMFELLLTLGISCIHDKYM